jgi:transposase
MKIKEVLGIDVSKLTLDCHLHNNGVHKVFDNNPEGIAKMLEWALKSEHKENLLTVFEHTGLYSHRLAKSLAKSGCHFHIASGLDIKRSLGIVRGKDDKADAKRIALYGYRLREELYLFQPYIEVLDVLKRLMSMRKKLVVQRAGHITTLGEQKRVLDETENKILFQSQEEIIASLNKQISVLEKEMDKLIRQNPELSELHKLLVSVKGIGSVTARFLIVYTNGFTAFKSWRKFASYCGIAPFPNCSGTSVRGRTKVSHLANKEGKTLLNLCAISVIQSSPEMKTYYERRIQEGKNKMSTLNIIRNKLLARAFAVVHRKTPYVDTMRYAS